MSLSVAIIDPDMNVASTVEATFQNLGFEAHVLGDGDVVEFVRNKAPTVILLNVELPRGSGYSFCNRLKKQADLKRIPIILTSGQETAEAFAQHQRTPTRADAYMHKPFSVDQLIDAVGKLIPDAFPNGRAPVPGATAQIGAPSPNGAQNGQQNGALASGEGSAAMPAPAEQSAQRSSPAAGGGAPPMPGARAARPERAGGDKRGGAGPSLDELIAQGRTEQPPQAPSNAAGPEAKLTFLRDSLRQKEQDIARAKELWATREREIAQLGEVLELRERELERARKAREDLLAQLTTTEDKVAALRLDVELGSERSDRLE
ncbi:MAG TPA: response regulator, partial [Myxococcota bacterium]